MDTTPFNTNSPLYLLSRVCRLVLDILEGFENRVWETRKSRIVASERLRKIDAYTKFLMSYYSLVIVLLSVWQIYPRKSFVDLTLPLVIASIAALCVTLFINSMDYGGRSSSLKSCYLKLDSLISEIRLLKVKFSATGEHEYESTADKIRELEQKYLELLDGVENHKIFDDWEVIRTNDTTKSLTHRQDALLNIYKSSMLLTQLALVIVPLIPLVVVVFGGRI